LGIHFKGSANRFDQNKWYDHFCFSHFSCVCVVTLRCIINCGKFWMNWVKNRLFRNQHLYQQVYLYLYLHLNLNLNRCPTRLIVWRHVRRCDLCARCANAICLRLYFLLFTLLFFLVLLLFFASAGGVAVSKNIKSSTIASHQNIATLLHWCK